MTIGRRIYLSILTLFAVFAIFFIVFQQYREKEYKIETLNQRLQSFNVNMEEALGVDGHNSGKYLCSTVQKVLGKKLSDEAIKANEEKAKKIAEKLAYRDQLLKQLKEKKETDIKQIEAQYAKNWHDICDQYKKWIDAIKAA